MALLWVLNLSDGQHDLLAIAERSGEPFGDIRNAAQALLSCELLKEVAGKPVA
jgi:aminopeptidase-like protein